MRDRIDPDFQYDLDELIQLLDFEHNEWHSRQHLDWHTQDTIFFSIAG